MQLLFPGALLSILLYLLLNKVEKYVKVCVISIQFLRQRPGGNARADSK